MIRSLLRRVLLGANPVPQYAVIGIHEPQQRIRVELRGSGPAVDVTRNNVAVSLSPLRFAIALSPDRVRALQNDGGADLVFIEQHRAGRELGQIGIDLEDTKPLQADVLCIFRSGTSINRCVPRWRSMVYDLYRSWSARRRNEQHNHQLSRRDLQSFFVFYTCPRPVVLVTVCTDDGGNIFPMDLIGPSGGRHFLLALHTTSPSVERIRNIRQLTISHVPVELTDVVYELGKNHRVADIDWDELSLPVQESPLNGWPVPKAALKVSDLSVEQVYDMGSHTLFVTRIVAEQRIAEGPRMSHIQGYYQDYLRRRGEKV